MAGLDPSIGLSALLAAQRGLDTVGNNVANASTPGYTREVVQLSEAPASNAPGGQVGNGVQIGSVSRVADAFLDGRVRDATATNAADSAEAQRLAEVQGIVAAQGTGSLASLVSSYYSSAQALAASPSDAATRASFVSTAQQMAQGFQQAHTALEQTRADIGSEVTQDVSQANDLAKQVATLNNQIQDIQAQGQSPNALTDQRNQLVLQLSTLVGAQGTARADGTMDVAVGGQLLVSGTHAQTLQTATDPTKGTVVRYAGSTANAAITSGTVGGLLSVSGTTVPSLESQLDQLAVGIASQANAVNATGVPTNGPMTSLTTTVPVQDVNKNGDATDDVLARAGLPTTPTAGTISVNVTDLATNTVTTARVAFDPSKQSLRDLASSLSQVPGIRASAGQDGLLRISAASGMGFDFADRTGASASDTGGVLGALGAAPVFTGTGAGSMTVASSVANDPTTIATGVSTGAGDGSNAARLADSPVTALGGQGPSSFLSVIVANAGSAASDANTRQSGSQTALGTLTDSQQSVSGVSTEEEVANMIRFQNSFQAASQYLAVIDKLTQSLMSIVGQ